MRTKLIGGLGILGLGMALYPITVHGREGGQGAPAFVSYGKQVLLIGETEPIAGGKTLMAAWSPDSQSVIALRQFHSGKSGTMESTSEVSLVLWDAVTRRSREIWHKQIELTGYEGSHDPEWMQNTGVAFVPISWHRNPQEEANHTSNRGVLRVDTVRGIVTEISVEDIGGIQVSPARPLAVVVNQEYPQNVASSDAPPAENTEGTVRAIAHVTPLNANGTLGKPLPPLPNASFFGWTEDGQKMVWVNVAVVDKKPVRKYFLLNPLTGETSSPSETLPQTFARKPVLPTRLSLRMTSAKIQEGKTAHTLHPIWLESKGKRTITRALLTADGKPGSLSPNGRNALFFSQGATWVVALRPTSKAEYLSAARQTLISNARQAGTALMMYVQDYDEIFPPSEGDFVEVVNPYIKNRDILEGMSYSRPGNGLADISKPAETVMGTFPGPGGSAVVYADGHAKWIPDPATGGEDDDD